MSRDALVVGINTYQYLPSLKAPARDAEAIAQQLQTYGEFRVHRLPEIVQAGKPQVGQKTQVTLRQLETALINLFKPKGNSIPQTALFYFSGHGIQREAGIREGYLALSDANAETGCYGLSLFWLRRLLQESPVRQRIVWLDCCHSGELLNFLEADPGARPGTDRLFMAASREYETAYESLESPYSVFTEALLTGLDPTGAETGIVTNHALTNWVNHALKGEIQQPLFESSGSEIVLTRAQNGQPRTAVSDMPQQEICPYRGLAFFDESHAAYFFGREDLTAQLIETLQKQPFIAVTGASGSGKSSLVRAGLMARLRQKNQTGSQSWKIRLITPTEHPLKSLAAAFIDPELSGLERAEQLRRAETFLQNGGTGLAQLVRASLPISASSIGSLSTQRPQFLLVIDQFEEVFTLSQGAQAERERQEFFDCLLGALQDTQNLLKIVLVLRADFLHQCSFYEGLAEQITQHQVTALPLKYEQIKATIVRPAQKVGLLCEPNLVYTMLSDIIGAPAELPLLQYTLAELWSKRQLNEGGTARLTLDAYQALGGVRGTLQKRATEVFHSLTATEQSVARRIFLSLTQLGEGTEDTRRRVFKSELISPTFSIERVERVLEKLVAAKLIVISQDNTVQDPVEGKRQPVSPAHASATEIVDVAHEALIRNWSLLRTWLDQNRDILRRQRRIEQSAQEWHQVGQPEQGEYLLHGLRLRDAEDFLKLHAQELSALAQQYILVSCTESCRARRKSRRLQLAIPSFLVATLTMVLSQYYGTMWTQTKKETQLQQATMRERAAIAQTVLQDPHADPMTALLISRSAATQSAGFEAQSSLRAALQDLRLQLDLQGHQGAIQQVTFSPNRRYLASAGADGTVRLWTINPQTIYNTSLKPAQVFTWSERNQQTPIQAIAFSPDGQQLVATAQDSPTVKVWSVKSATLLLQLTSEATVQQVSFSPDGQWIATVAADHSFSLWHAQTGALKARFLQKHPIHSIQFSADSRSLLVAEAEGDVQLWRFTAQSNQTLQLKLTKTFTHPKAIVQASFSPQARWIATLCKDGKVRLWDQQTGAAKFLLPHPHKQALVSQPPDKAWETKNPFASIKQMAFSPDQQTLATVDANHRVWLWNTATGQLQSQLDEQETVVNSHRTNISRTELLLFSPDGQTILTTAAAPNRENGFYSAYLWNRSTGKQIAKLFGHQENITSAQFSPDGLYLVTASADGTMRFWATESGGELPSIRFSQNPVESVAFLPGFIQTQPEPYTHPAVEGTHAQTLAPLNAISSQSPPWIDTPWQPINWRSLLLFKDQISHWRMWLWGFAPQPSQPRPHPDPLGLDPGHPYRQPSSNLLHPTAVPTPKTAVTNMVAITANGQLQQWQILTDRIAHPDQDNAASVALEAGIQQKVATLTQSRLDDSDSSSIQPVTAGFAQLAQLPLQNRAAAAPVSLLEKLGIPHAKVALSKLALSPNGALLATTDLEGLLTVYQVQANRSLQRLYQLRNQHLDTPPRSATPGNPAKTESDRQSKPQQNATVAIQSLSFSPDGEQLLGVADDLTIRLWQARSGQLLQVLRGHEAAIRQARYSADGQKIISASWDRTARIWQASTGQMLEVLPHQETVSSASFSPDGQRAVTTSWNGTAQIWQLGTGKPPLILNRHHKAVLDAQFSPDGQQLVTASADGTARLWNAISGEEQALLQPRSPEVSPEAIVQAFFSPDGQYVATLTKLGQVHLWAATQEMLLELARRRSLRQLTPNECSHYLRLTAEQCPKLPL